MGGFGWHPAARVFDAAGLAVVRGAEARGVLPDRPAGQALAALGAGPFRIGGAGPAPEPGPAPVFETLTGGSSGAPRRIRRSQASWLASFAVNAQLFGIGPGVRVAVLGRLVHSLALYGAVEALCLGAELHLLDTLRPKAQRAALAARRIGLLYATPAQLRLLVEARGPALPDLNHVLVGGSKLDMGLRAMMRVLAPVAELREFYGAAEASFITLAGPETPPDSVGSPYPGVELRIEAGEVWVKSPYLFEAYAGDPGAARWSDGWLSFGEMGEMRDGNLYLLGRAGRMVKVADQAVYPEAIEAFLMAQPGVARAAVLPRPDALRGVQLVAVLAGDPDCAPAIGAALRGRFGALAAPRSLIWREDWPMLASGKTDLVRLAGEIG
ncbi:AMP-binding protein [bacterium]|nr:AMP-binding protein [bacterium]